MDPAEPDRSGTAICSGAAPTNCAPPTGRTRRRRSRCSRWIHWLISTQNGPSNDLHLLGSTQLAQTLAVQQVVDEYRLMIDPVVVGGGKRLFNDDGALRHLRLVDSQTATTGAIIITYAAGEP